MTEKHDLLLSNKEFLKNRDTRGVYRIFCDNLIEANWFTELSSELSKAEINKMQARGANPRAIDALIEYDRPDIILLQADRPVLVLEKSREVPTGHNVGQRFARLVRAAELGVPTIKFFPFDAMKHGKYANVCNLNIRLLKAFEEMLRIHKTPILAINWPCDKHHELIDDGSENTRVSAIVTDYLSSGCNPNCREILAQLRAMRNELSSRLSRRKLYGDPPGSVELLDTSALLKRLNKVITPDTQKALMGRPRSVLYTIKMTPANCRREDPYTGTQFIYDYHWCRSGPRVEDKSMNLILHFPRITREVWHKNNPNDTSRKSCNWYLTANALVFSDSADLLRK